MKNGNGKSNFDPQKHLIKIKGKDYLEVKFRLHWFRSEKPSWDVNTTIEKLDIERGIAVIRADVYDDQGQHRAAGIKMEYKSNFHDYAEKASTGAIGRALATLGYGTLQCASEMDEGLEKGRIVDAPVNLPSNGGNNGQTGNGKATQKQLGYIQNLCRKLAVPPLENPDISKEKASEYIEQLQKKLNMKKPKKPTTVVSEKADGNGGNGNTENIDINKIISRW